MNLIVERPPIFRYCKRCDARPGGTVIVSPAGTAHYASVGGVTDCGVDATGDKWWWPL